jgi:hypothetical protein
MNGVRAWLSVSLSFPGVLLDRFKCLKLLSNVLYVQTEPRMSVANCATLGKRILIFSIPHRTRTSTNMTTS